MNPFKKNFIRIAAVALGLIALLVSGQALAQDGGDALPPHVVDVWPAPGAEVAPAQPVTITFDQPMDAASVEAAWQIDPAASGAFTWQDDRTVSFLPDANWPRATRFNVTIGTGAMAQNGQALVEPYAFFVQTVGVLDVTTVIPAPDAEGIQADATITVAFSRPVVPLVTSAEIDDLPSPLVFEPAIEGEGEWVNTSVYVFTPSKPLQGGTTYTAIVPAGLEDVTGSPLSEGYQWQFKTLVPEILNVFPTNGQQGIALDQPLTIMFSQPMDTASTEAAFSLAQSGQMAAGSFSWSDDGRTMTFAPDGGLLINTNYAMNLAPTAQSASGAATLREGVTVIFQTVPYPGIRETYPGNGDRDVSPGGGVSIEFKSPMNTETFAGKVEILEPSGVTWEPRVYGDSELYLEFATLPETTYTIVFRQGAEDVYGNVIETDYTFSFTTARLEPRAWLSTRGQLMITNAYRENTRIALGVQAKPIVSFALYGLADSEVGFTEYSYYDRELEKMLGQERLLRQWEQQLDAGPTQQGVGEVFLATEAGGRLDPGVYMIETLTPKSDYPQWMALGVVSANLTLKRSSGEVLVWVTDLESGAPVADTTVTLYDLDGRELVRGGTDSDGLFRTTQPGTSDTIYAVARGAGAYGVWTSWGAPGVSDSQGYVYTDRPIYRPAQTVYFRGVVRDRDDMTYSVPGFDSVDVTIAVNWGSQMLLETTLPVNEFGTFNGELELPEDAEIGQAQIEVRAAGGYYTQVSFTIAEFRTPEYQITVTPERDEIVQGDPLKVIATASYYFGGAVSDAQASWWAQAETAYFNYSGPGRYNFTDETQGYVSQTLGSDQVQTDSSGRVVVDLENTQVDAIRPISIMVETEVVDESGQYIAGRTSVLAHPADVYVGLRTDKYFGRENTPVNVDLIAVTPESAAIPNQRIELEVVEVRWERIPIEGEFGRYDWEQQEIVVATDEVRTGDDGTAQYSFTPEKAGIYRVRALVRDERERENSSTLRLWVTGSTSVWWGRPSSTIDLIADKDSYQPGDTASILIPTPFTGTSYALITLERAGIQQVEVLPIEGSSLLYEFPITDQHAPTVYFSVTLVKGTDVENLNPQYRTGLLSLNVEPVNARLLVEVTPSATLAQPGQEVSFAVKTTGPNGEPVSAEVGVTLTDLAILSLMPPNSAPIELAFYGEQYDAVQSTVSLEALIDTMTDEILKEQAAREAAEAPMAAMPTATANFGGEADGIMMEAAMDEEAAPGGDVSNVTIRQDFQETPLWAPRVITDASGEAVVSVVLPDNLTTWHLDARGLTLDTLVGDAALDVVSTLPLLTRPVAPRFFVVGDHVTLASVINNNTDAEQRVEATLQASGVTLESDATQTVSIPAGSRARVEWIVTVEDVPYVDLTFFAVGADGYQDAVKPTLATGPDGTIPVYRYTAPDTVGTGGLIRNEGAITEAISLPPRLDTDQGELTLHLDPSLAVTTIDALDYLKNYEHQCIEQTISRFLPNVMTYRALRDLGIDDPALKESLDVVLRQALDRLAKEQNYDGGWGWFSQMESNPYITAYAVLGLVEAADAGFTVDPDMTLRALNFVQTDLIRPNIDTPTWVLNRQAFYLYVFARAGQPRLGDMNALLEQRLEIDTWAQSFLLMAYHAAAPDDPAVAQLISDVQSSAILSATGAHWEEGDVDWWNWNTDLRTTAIALTALARVQPDNALLPNVVRWLMVAREGAHWTTTQQTAWAVMGLTDWMKVSGELDGDYTFTVALNGDGVADGTVTPETIREGTVIEIPVADLLRDEVNRLSLGRSDGEGVLYYSAHLNTRLWASEAEPVDRGVSVQRQYFLEGDPKTPVTSASAGEIITVRVTMTLSQNIYYFVLEDPIPAGTEPVDTSLLTTTQSTGEAPQIQPDRDPYWYWGWWYFDHTEMRDEKVNLYADYLPRGTYTYTYQVRASIPGEFQTMPSHAYAFYFPEVFGRGAGSLFTVTPSAE